MINNMYSWLKKWFGHGVNETQCRRAVELKKIDKTQFKEIVGKDFE